MTSNTHLQGDYLSGQQARRAPRGVTVGRELLSMGLAALLALLLVAACGGRDDDRSDDLGIDTELGPRLDPDGNPLPADFHPLSKTHRTLAPLAELYYAGMTINGKSQGLLDDRKAGGATLFNSEDESWASASLAASRGDVDGDGYDEILVAYLNRGEGLLRLRVIDREGEQYTETVHTIAEGLDLGDSTSYDLPPMLAVAAGDLDHDGRDEIAVGIGNRLVLVDDAQVGYSTTQTVTYDTPDADGLAMMQLGFGDFNGDGKDQLFVALSLTDADVDSGRVNWYRYDGSLDSASASDELTLDVDYDRHVFKLARMAVADIDGDGLSEVVFNAAGNTGHFAFFMDDEKAESALKGAYELGSTWKLGMAVAALDADGDGVAEVLAGDALLKYSRNTGEWTHKGELPFEPIGEKCSSWDILGLICLGGMVPVYKPANALTEVYGAGDFNGDYRVEVAVRRGAQVQLWGLDETGELALHPQTLPVSERTSRTPALVGANTDADSLIVRYTGEHELLFSKPQVVAVMAAPPTWANKGQNVDGSGTTFGRTSGTETESSESLGFMVGHSIGVGNEFSILGVADAGSFELKASFEHAFNWSTMHGSAIETSYSFTSGPGEDKVVFTSIPYDVYYYEVISSPDASGVGEIISINVPRTPQTIAVTREFYNAHNGDAPDIDASVLGHTVGNPWSYPTPDEKKDLLDERGGWVNEDMVTVGEGSGVATLTIASTETTAHGRSYDFDATVELEVGAGPVKLGVAGGFHYGTEYSVAVSDGFFLEGTIGEIPAQHFSAGNSYRVGIFAYPHQTESGHEFMVVSYWVAE